MTSPPPSTDTPLVDVLVIGGGIAGASLAAEIMAFRRVVLAEAEERCGMHATGRSAAFYLESYGGAAVSLLSRASYAFLADPPADFAERSFLSPRGAIHLSRTPQPEATLDRAALESRVKGLRPGWDYGWAEENCADIDVAALHQAYLAAFRHAGGEVWTESRLAAAHWDGSAWRVRFERGGEARATVLVDAAGAWADTVAEACGVRPLGILPKRRTMIQLRVGRHGLRHLPQLLDHDGRFYLKGEGDNIVWLSPHDEIATEPCDAAPEEIDVATAIDRFASVVDWPIEAVERRWAGLRSFAPDRVPVYGFDPRQPNFFWCAGQGGFGIQTAPAAARLAASLLLGVPPHESLTGIDPALYSPARFG